MNLILSSVRQKLKYTPRLSLEVLTSGHQYHRVCKLYSVYFILSCESNLLNQGITEVTFVWSYHRPAENVDWGCCNVGIVGTDPDPF